MATDDQSYGLRKRRKPQPASYVEDDGLDRLLDVAAGCQNIVVFSGSGLSASSGMSTFSTRGGLYERAQKKYKLNDGKTLFTYAFFDRQRAEAQAFFADIYTEALHATPAPGHMALRALYDAGRLRRHYTLNIDGLAEQAGMPTWHHERSPQGVTVEMHGNVKRLVCPECHATLPMNAALAKQIRARQAVPCPAPGCGYGALRFQVMMYDDGEADCITPDEVLDLMEEDVKAADLVLWVGISFQQSASTAYFRNVRGWMQEAGRPNLAMQALVNPSDEALFNLRTALSNQSELSVLEVLSSADDVLPQVAAGVRPARRPAPSPAGRPRRAASLGILSKLEAEAEDELRQDDTALAAGVGIGGVQRSQQARPPLSPLLPQRHQQQQQQQPTKLQQAPALQVHPSLLAQASQLLQAQQVSPEQAFMPPAALSSSQALLLQALGCLPPATAPLAAVEAPQATMQTLESLSQLLLRALELVTQQQPQPQQQLPQLPVQLEPQQPSGMQHQQFLQQQQQHWEPTQRSHQQAHAQPGLMQQSVGPVNMLQMLLQAMGRVQPAALPPDILPLLQQQLQQAAGVATAGAALVVSQGGQPEVFAGPEMASSEAAAALERGPSPRAVLLQQQDSDGSDEAQQSLQAALPMSEAIA